MRHSGCSNRTPLKSGRLHRGAITSKKKKDTKAVWNWRWGWLPHAVLQLQSTNVNSTLRLLTQQCQPSLISLGMPCTRSLKHCSWRLPTGKTSPLNSKQWFMFMEMTSMRWSFQLNWHNEVMTSSTFSRSFSWPTSVVETSLLCCSPDTHNACHRCCQWALILSYEEAEKLRTQHHIMPTTATPPHGCQGATGWSWPETIANEFVSNSERRLQVL